MCLGIFGKFAETYREHDVLMGEVDELKVPSPSESKERSP